MMRRVLCLLLCLPLGLLAGCQLTLPTRTPDAAPQTLTAPAIETSVLAPAGSPATDAAPAPPPQPTPSVAAAPPEPEPATPDPAPVVKTALHLDCEKAGGSFVTLSDSGAQTCQRPTRDGGKACSKQGDCQGSCLARSRSCAPITPLLGCNEVLQADGSRGELCIN